MKHRPFEIKVVLTELLVISIGLILFILPFLMTKISLIVLTTTIFFLFCLLGYLLIKNTIKEARQKEILEKEVRERTKDVEEAKKIAEGRAEELEVKGIELEKSFRGAVERELIMADMKNKIKILKTKTI